MTEPPAPGLQFDKAEFASNEAAAAVCAGCQTPIAGDYYDVNGRTLCPACKAQVEQVLGGRPGSGAQLELQVGNGSGNATPAVLLLGAERARIATPLGGELLVEAAMQIPLTLDASDTSFTMNAPRDLAGGQTFQMQVLTVDAGATHGIAFSKGLEVRLAR